jgi:hypothetical protein
MFDDRYSTCELQQLGAQLESLNTIYPETVILGSLGRAAIMQENLPPRRPDGTLRDIDALRTGYNDHTENPFDVVKGPFIIDDVFHEWITFGDRSSWLVCPYATNIQEEISNDVFAVTRHPVAGSVAQTFNPHTQLYIQGMMGRSRAKDIEPVARFSAFVASQPNPLPQELYDPFDRFRAAVIARNQRRGLQYAEKAGGMILACIPERVKSVARPSFRRVTHKVIDLVSREANG